MRQLPVISEIIDSNDNKFIGVNKSHGRVTVEPAWRLNVTGTTYGALENGPYRYWAYADNSQVELEVPNIDSISINRSLDQEAATCTIVMSNQAHDDNDETPSTAEFGNPGYYGFDYGGSPSANVWGQDPNIWNNILVPNALLRTYQGYGGYTVVDGQLQQDSITNAVSSGNIVVTGVWLIDTVSMGTNGKIQLQCRDMAKLLIEQKVYPPLIPERHYPPKYCAFLEDDQPGSGEGVAPDEPLVNGPVDLQYETSSMLIWFGQAGIDDIIARQPASIGDPANAFSFNESQSSLGKGWRFWDNTYAYDWWQATCTSPINEVYVNCKGSPPGGSYTVYISVMEDGQWQDDGGTIVYTGDEVYEATVTIVNSGNTATVTHTGHGLLTGRTVKIKGASLPANNGAYLITVTGPNTYQYTMGSTPGSSPTGTITAIWGSNVQIWHPEKPSLGTGIGYVKKTGIEVKSDFNENLQDGTWVTLPRVYDPERIRITIKSTWDSPWGGNTYRSGVGAIRTRLANVDVNTEETTINSDSGVVVNYIKDWVDPVKELLMWSGFLLYDGETPQDGWTEDNNGVFGTIESSGTYPVECLHEDLFDKKSVMDSLISIKEVLGYVFFIDEEGSVHFHSPNWWSEGNTIDGLYSQYIHLVTDENIMTDYTSNYNDSGTRSEIVIGSSLVDDVANETVSVSLDPRVVEAEGAPDVLRGMVRPTILINEVWTNENEQKLMAALIAIHALVNSRQGSVTIVANPAIQINDTVRITERVTSEDWVHYVRSISSEMNLETGEWTMTLGTNWLGESGGTWRYDRNYLLSLYNRNDASVQTNYENGYESWVAFQDSRTQDLRIPTVFTETPASGTGEGGYRTVGVIVGSDPQDGREAYEIADPDIVAFMYQAGARAGTWIKYVFSSSTVPTQSDGRDFDILVVTSDAIESDINAWGSFAPIEIPIIHAKPVCWGSSEITTNAPATANSNQIEVINNSAFDIAGTGTVDFGDGDTVTSYSIPSAELPTNTEIVGESPVTGDVVIAAIPLGQTYDDAGVSLANHVIWGSDLADPDLYAPVAWNAMGDALNWLKDLQGDG